jgi:chemotaxis protein CheD
MSAPDFRHRPQGTPAAPSRHTGSHAAGAAPAGAHLGAHQGAHAPGPHAAVPPAAQPPAALQRRPLGAAPALPAAALRAPAPQAAGAKVLPLPRPAPAAPAVRTAPRAPAAPAESLSFLNARPGDHLVLMPGQLHFGRVAASLRTLLGSCVAITLWHPQKRLGGMCHFLLPSRTRPPGAVADGRFGDEAVGLMVEMLTKLGTQPSDYVAHLYGGADTMPDSARTKLNIGERNIEQGWSLIDRYGFQLDGVDVGDNVPRTVMLDCASGQVQIKRSARL